MVVSPRSRVGGRRRRRPRSDPRQRRGTAGAARWRCADRSERRPAARQRGAGTVAPCQLARALGLPDSVRACLFDLDGVLTRTATVHMAAWKRTFDEFLRRPRPGAGRVQPATTTTASSTASRGPTASATSWPAAASRCPEGSAGRPGRRRDRARASPRRKNELVLRELDEHGVEVYPGSVRYLRGGRRTAGLATAVVTASANGEQVIAAAGFADLHRRPGRRRGRRAGGPARQARAGHLPGRRPGPRRRAGAGRRLRGRARPGSPPGGPGTSATSSASTGSARPTSCAAHGADVVVTDLAELLGRRS